MADLLKRAFRHYREEGFKSVLFHIIKNLSYFILPPFAEPLRNTLVRTPTIWGDSDAVSIHETAWTTDTFFNSNSGEITVEEHVIFGHDIKVITGMHDYTKTGQERKDAVPDTGRDIIIHRGAFIGTGAIIIGPCEIGRNAVICAGSVVTSDVEANTMYGGNPAEFIKEISISEEQND